MDDRDFTTLLIERKEPEEMMMMAAGGNAGNACPGGSSSSSSSSSSDGTCFVSKPARQCPGRNCINYVRPGEERCAMCKEGKKRKLQRSMTGRAKSMVKLKNGYGPAPPPEPTNAAALGGSGSGNKGSNKVAPLDYSSDTTRRADTYVEDL